jgi:hypothetical protein
MPTRAELDESPNLAQPTIDSTIRTWEFTTCNTGAEWPPTVLPCKIMEHVPRPFDDPQSGGGKVSKDLHGWDKDHILIVKSRELVAIILGSMLETAILVISYRAS